MRKVVYAINLTLDGCCDHTKGMADEELHYFYANLLRKAGLLAYGRVTYELMVPYWPDIAKNTSGQQPADIAFAEAFNAVDKVVFSQTLEKVDDPRSRLVRTKPEDEIMRLKQESGGDILLGGVSLPTYLMGQGLVDEFIFVIQPTIAGPGRRLMDGMPLPEQYKLKLADATTLKSGSVVLHYHKG